MQKNLEWINKVSPGVYETIMPRISEGLELHINNIKQELARIDINLRFPNRVIDAYSILKKLDPIKDLEKNYPSLRLLTAEINKRFYAKIQNCIDQFLIYFNLQSENISQLIHQKRDLLNRKEDAEFEKNLLSSRFIFELNESIKQRQEKIKEDIREIEYSIKNLETQIITLSKQRPQYDFFIKIDCHSAITALEFIENCENTGDDHLKIITAVPLNLLTNYIKEYGVNLDTEISENFQNAIKHDSQEPPLLYSCDLESKTSDS